MASGGFRHGQDSLSYLSVYPPWHSMVTKHFIAPIQGSVAAADTLEGHVPLVGGYDPPMGGYNPPGRNFDRSQLRPIRVSVPGTLNGSLGSFY